MHDKDDPFFDMDDEHTIIKPNPRGRPPGQSQAPRPQRSADPGRKVDLSSRPGLNPIEKAASVLLSLLSQIRNTSTHPNPNGLHKQLATEIQNFEKSAQRAGINEKTIFVARYALCTTIDEFVMTTPWGSGSIWGNQSLLSLFHKETRGGERFFQLLNKLNEDPAKNIDLLELLYLCLALGFQGRYRVRPNGLNELEEIRESLYYTIRNQRQEAEPELSPNWEGLNKSAIDKPALVPAWLAASIAIMLLVGLFSAWRFSLGNKIDPVHARVMNIGREESLLPTRLLAPPAAVYIPDPGPARFGLQQFLEPEIRSGQVTVEELPDRIVVSIAGDNLFDSGSEIISSKYNNLINRIGEGLEQTSGRIKVVGHTDNVPMGRNNRFGSNFSLSQARAESVVNLLKASVSNPSRLTAEGLGDTRPIASNATAAGRAQNRRVEIILMERARG
ncbi:MAG: type IVB secretion system protein IcmH/DotU [Lysobacterales bacterium]